jgi:dihydrofolate reductase
MFVAILPVSREEGGPRDFKTAERANIPTPNAPRARSRCDVFRASGLVLGSKLVGRRSPVVDCHDRLAPFHTPVFVLTHNAREPWVRPGGTTFHFVTDGPQSALAQAKAAAGGKDVRISGGADVVQQYLKVGAVEELEIALAPVLFGGGRRLFENLGDGLGSFKIDRALHTPLATHLRYLPS